MKLSKDSKEVYFQPKLGYENGDWFMICEFDTIIYTKKLWKNGEKKTGFIVDAGYFEYNGRNAIARELIYDCSRYIYYVIVQYSNTKHITINGIKDDKAFKILKLLL